MTEDKKESRGFLRAFLIVVAVMFFVPAAMLFALWMSRVAQVKEHALSQRNVVVHSPAISDRRAIPLGESESPASDNVLTYRPVTETSLREEIYRVNVPVVDPETGRTTIREESRVRQVPVMTTRQVATFHAVTHDQKVMQAVGELRNMKEEDENREQKMNELRQRLELEFSQMHEKQTEEIAETSKRLDALKELHQQRGENKDRIVERRINELMGKSDEFGWHTNVPPELAKPDPAIRSMPLNHGGPPPLPGVQFRIPAPAKAAGAAPRYQPPENISAPQSNFKKVPMTSPRIQRITEAQRSQFANDSTTSDELAPPPEANPTIVVASSGIGELFQFARAAAAANADLKSAEVEYEESKILKSNRAITDSALRQSELKLEKAKREVELNNMQLSALKDSMTRARELAAAEKKHASAKMRAAQNSGNTFTGDREEIAFEIEKATRAYEEAAANLSQLAKVLELVEGAGTKSQTEEPADDGGQR